MGGIFSTRRSLIFTEEYRDRVLKTDPIGYWVQDEAGGAVSYDMVTQFSGGARNGTYVGVTLGQPGIGDGRTAPLFDGALDYNDIYSASLAAAFNGAEGTLMAWARVFNVGVWTDGVLRDIALLFADANNFVVIQKSAVDNRASAQYTASGTVQLRNVALVSPPTVAFPFAITWSALADEVRVYIDGIQQGATMNGLGVWAGVLAATNTTIGAASTAPILVWNGYIAHAAVWDRPLAPAEVLSLGVL